MKPHSTFQALRIAHVVSYYPPHKGGTEYAALAIATEQAKQGHSVTVITSSVGHKAGVEKQQGVTVHYLRTVTVANTPVFVGLPALLAKLPLDIVHVHVAQAFAPESVLVTCKARGIPYVAHLHLDVGASSAAGVLLPVYKKIFLAPVLRRAAAVFVLNESFEKLMSEKYRVPANKIHIMPNGVDENFFVPAKTQQSKPLRILTISRLSPQKRVHILIESLQHMHALADLYIVGEGELHKELVAQAQKTNYSHRIHFLGNQERPQVLEQMKQADIFSLSSEREGLPLALVEAMAAQVPIVASDVIGNHEFVGNAGILVSPVNAKNMAAGFDQVAKDSKLRAQLTRRGLEKARKHRWPLIVSDMVNVYSECIAKRNSK